MVVKNFVRWISDVLEVISNPGCWIQSYRYSPEWDVRLVELMESHTFERCSAHTAKLGLVTLWISNAPYSTMHPYSLERPVNCRARRITILRAVRKCDRDLIAEYFKKGES